MALIERENSTITLTSYDNGVWQLNCGSQEATRATLERLAQAWQGQEQVYLPISRYLVASVQPVLNQTLEMTNNLIDEIAKLEKRLGEQDIKNLFRRVNALESRLEATRDFTTKEFREQGKAITEIGDAFSLHKKSRFHFLDRKGRQ